MSAFFNSNKETGQKLAASEKKAKSQNVQILGMFNCFAEFTFTPWEMFEVFEQKYPLTSVRRSIHTLCDNGLIGETGGMRKGGYGKLNRVYRITKKGLNF